MSIEKSLERIADAMEAQLEVSKVLVGLAAAPGKPNAAPECLEVTEEEPAKPVKKAATKKKTTKKKATAKKEEPPAEDEWEEAGDDTAGDEPVGPECTLEELRDVARALMKGGKKAQFKDVLKRFDVATLTDLEEKCYDTAMKQLKEELDA